MILLIERVLKLAVSDETGKVLDIAVIYPHKPAPQIKRQAAGPLFKDLITKYGVQMIAIGNGTASRESEQFVAEQIRDLKQEVYYVIVNEAGASVSLPVRLPEVSFRIYK